MMSKVRTSVIMLNAHRMSGIMPSGIMLSIVMLGVPFFNIMLSVVMLNLVILSAVLLNVVAPKNISNLGFPELYPDTSKKSNFFQ